MMHVRAAEFDRGEIKVAIVVPTFRRRELLRDTLVSLGSQSFDGPFCIVVVENDCANAEGFVEAKHFFAASKVKGIVIREERQGNVFAINAGFETAFRSLPKASYFLMIDDDERADSDWIRAMVTAAERSGADIVGGPVFPDWDPSAPSWARAHPVFELPFDHSGEVPMIYGSGNCLLSRKLLDTMGFPLLDVRFNYLGGGDTEFFFRCRKAGFRFYYEASAAVREHLSPDRLTLKWVCKRGLRIGAINRSLDLKHGDGALNGARVCAKDAAILAISPLRGAMTALRTGSLHSAMHPFMVALGRLGSTIGIEPQPYKSSPPQSR